MYYIVHPRIYIESCYNETRLYTWLIDTSQQRMSCNNYVVRLLLWNKEWSPVE